MGSLFPSINRRTSLATGVAILLGLLALSALALASLAVLRWNQGAMTMNAPVPVSSFPSGAVSVPPLPDVPPTRVSKDEPVLTPPSGDPAVGQTVAKIIPVTRTSKVAKAPALDSKVDSAAPAPAAVVKAPVLEVTSVDSSPAVPASDDRVQTKPSSPENGGNGNGDGQRGSGGGIGGGARGNAGAKGGEP